MTVEQIKEYLWGILKIEKNIYVQECMIAQMKQDARKLGHKKAISAPVKEKVKTGEIFSSICMMLGIIGATIGGIIGTIIGVNIGLDEGDNIIEDIVGFVVYGVIGILIGIAVGAAVLAVVGALIAAIKNRNFYDNAEKKYNSEYNLYMRRLGADKTRVEKELAKRNMINAANKELQVKLDRLKEIRKELYELNVLHESYQYFGAAAAIYSYLDKGITQSLKFDATTGDQGAYKIYEDELKFKMVFATLQEIVDRLDTVIENQINAQNLLKEGIREFKAMREGMNNFIEKTYDHYKTEEEQLQAIRENSEDAMRAAEYVAEAETFRIYMDYVKK